MGELMKDFDGKGKLSSLVFDSRFFLCLLDWNCVYSNEISSTVLDYSKSCFCWVCCDVVLDRIASVQ